MVYTLEHVRSDRGVNTVSDRKRPIECKPGIDADGGVEPDTARVAELLAQIGALGERIDAAAQRAVDSLRRAGDEPGIAAWDGAEAESLLELATLIENRRRRLDAALARDQARLRGDAASAGEPVAGAHAAMDPIGPGMI